MATNPGVLVPAFQVVGPLPMPAEEFHSRERISRRSCQRFAMKSHIEQRARDAISGLNWMAGCGLEENSGIQSPDQLKKDVIGRAYFLSGLCRDKGSLDEVPKPEAALMSLLRGRSEYGSERPTTLAVCKLERISMPSSLVNAPNAEDLLDSDARRYLQCPEQMLRANAEEVPEVCVPYWDPQLRADSGMYRRFVRKLHTAGYLTYTQHPKCFCGVFFVRKSDDKIRMIIDARNTNRLFKEPPGVELLTADGFSRVELVVPEHLEPGTMEHEEYLTNTKIHMGLSDVKDCFHRLRQPRWLSEFFCFDGIPAKWVNMGGQTLDGVVLDADSIIYPAPGSLCMGFTWSLYFAQKINERLMSVVPELRMSRLATDRC